MALDTFELDGPVPTIQNAALAATPLDGLTGRFSFNIYGAPNNDVSALWNVMSSDTNRLDLNLPGGVGVNPSALASGATPTLTKVEIMPATPSVTQGFTGNALFHRMDQVKIQGSNNPTAVGATWTDLSDPYDTVASKNPKMWYEPKLLTRIPVSKNSGTYAAYRVYIGSSEDGFGDICKVRFIGTDTVVRPGYLPCRPQFSVPCIMSLSAVIVTVTSPTNAASLIYTTDGSDPTFNTLTGAATNGAALANGGTIAVNATQNINAIAIMLDDTGLLYVRSRDISQGVYTISSDRVVTKWIPYTSNSPMYPGQYVEPQIANFAQGFMCSGNGFGTGLEYYWYGTTMQHTNDTAEVYPGIFLYTSSDGLNYTYQGCVARTQDNANSFLRGGVIYYPSNSADKKYIYYGRDYGTADLITFKGATASAFSYVGKSKGNGGVDVNDVSCWQDTADITKNWVFYVPGPGQATIMAVPLSGDGLTPDFANEVQVCSGGTTEAPCIHREGANIFLFYCDPSCYYTSNTSIGLQYRAAATMAGLNAVASASPFPLSHDPLYIDGAAVYHAGVSQYPDDPWNTQSTSSVFQIIGSSPAKIVFAGDWYDGGIFHLYAFRQTWCPVSFPSSATVLFALLPTWDLTDYIPPPAGTNLQLKQRFSEKQSFKF